MNTDIKISPENLLEWSDFEDWVNGTTSAPTEHTLSGTGATIARESTHVKKGIYSAAVTRVGNDVTLYHDLSSYASYLGRRMTYGKWVKCSVANRARIAISDGVGTSTSSYHTGGGDWEFLEVTRNIDASATRLRVEDQVNTGNTTAYFDGGILVEGNTTFVDLSTYVESIRPSRSFDIKSYNVIRRDGSLINSMNYNDLTLSIKGTVADNSISTARSTFDSLLAALTPHRKTPTLEDVKSDFYIYDDRRLRVFVESFSHEFIAAMKMIRFDLRLRSVDPFFRGLNKNRDSQTLASSPTSWTITNNGKVYSKPIIKVTAPGGGSITAVTIENLTTGEIMSYSGTIAASESLIIDTDAATVENDGANDIANFSGAGDFIRLVPGANSLKATFTGTANGTIKFDWFDKYL